MGYFEWPLLGFIIWWFVCQIIAQWSQRCKVISQFLNVMSLLPFTYVGGMIAYYELMKLGRRALVSSLLCSSSTCFLSASPLALNSQWIFCSCCSPSLSSLMSWQESLALSPSEIGKRNGSFRFL